MSIETNEKVFNILEQCKLNWTVRRIPLISNELNLEEQSFNNLPTSSEGVFRSDNKAHIGTVGSTYHPFQNFQLAETLVLATEELGLKISKGGLLHGGRLVYLQTELKEEFIGKSGVKRFVTALNSHDGSSQVGFGSSNTVVICQNTFYKAYKDVSKFRHSSKLNERVKAAIIDLRKAIVNDETLMKEFKVMSEAPLRDDVFAKILEKCFKVNLDAKSSDVSPQTIKKMNDVNASILAEMDVHGSNLWALFNGVTRYTNHYTTPKNKEQYIMTGGGYDTNIKAYNIISEHLKDKKLMMA